jgi:phage shock protein C
VQLFITLSVNDSEVTLHELDTEVDMPTANKVLRRSRHNRIIAGVCGGLADFFGISSFWFRLAFLIALLPGGIPGLAPYFILWIVIPND